MAGPRTLVVISNGLEVDVDFALDGESWWVEFGGSADFAILPGRYTLIVTPEGQSVRSLEMELTLENAAYAPAHNRAKEPFQEALIWCVDIEGDAVRLLAKAECERFLVDE